MEWQRPGVPVDAEVVSGNDGNRLLFVADGAGLFHSADDGETWCPVDIPAESGSGATSIGAHSRGAGPPLLLAGLVGGIARSIDLGVSWTVHPLPAPPPVVTSVRATATPSGETLAIAGSFEDGVYRSTDAGLTWRSANVGLFDHSIYAVDILPHVELHESMVLIGTSSGVSLSRNGGLSWSPLPFPELDSPVLSVAIVHFAAEQHRFLVGTEAGEMLTSNNPGSDWERINPGLRLGAAVRIEKLGSESRVVVAVFERGVMVSHDHGTTWQDPSDTSLATTGNQIVAVGLDGSEQADTTVLLGYTDATWISFYISTRS